MESANPWSYLSDKSINVRIAQEEDAGAITRLLQEAQFSHIHADWHYPAQWLGEPTFVVVPSTDDGNADDGKSSLARRLFNPQPSLQACLAVAADPPPAAWVRLATAGNKRHGRSLMATMLWSMEEALRDSKTSQVAWLLTDDWPELWLPDLGFEHVNDVLTYVKMGREIPRQGRPPDLEIRQAEPDDMARLAAIEARAFEPLWRHSELGLSLAWQQALSFDIAISGGVPVGFQFSSSTHRGAHLSRITVDTTAQKSGVGSALLSHALKGYYDQGITRVTLNTQLDNLASQNLYERFGFYASGERFPIWSIDLNDLP